ncbi:MAG: Fic family protein [Bacteroidales bacterium]|nr:Fic family protein [Bacteroidales bacterium]
MSEFDEYIRQGEFGPRQKAEVWQTAIGLQDVDGLKPSTYLIDTAKRHIEGDITIDEVKDLIDTYYKSREGRSSSDEERTEEADKVSARITELLQEESFSFTPSEYQRIHRRLFRGIFKFAGKYRTYNISKKEWVLDGDSVLYNPFENISETLDYDFSEERKCDYAAISTDDSIAHLAAFIAGLWQIHPFGEGNTRTTAVFLIKYLRSFGFAISNDLFATHSWFFRNALVRANYFNREKGIVPDYSFLVKFLRNLVLGEQNELKNRYLHINYQSEDKPASKSKICTLNCTLEELAVLRFLKENPKATQEMIAKHIHRSERTVKTMTVRLTEKQYLARKNGKRDGWWEVLVELPVIESE